MDICFGQRISEGDLVTGIYTNKTYTCENGLARKATKAEIELGHGCTENLTATGFVFQGKVCNEQGAWRDSTESEKIVGSLCVKPGTMTLGRKWSCDGEGKWTVISSDNVTSLGFIGKSVFVASYTARGTQLWTVRHLESMVLNFNDAKDYCSKLTWEKNGTKSAGFHLATEDDWATLLRYNEYARDNGYGDSTNLYKYYLRGESFYDSEADAGNKNCNTEERLGPDKRCASPTWVSMWTDDYSNGVTYTLYNTDEIKPTKAAVRSVDAYQQEPTTKQPFFCERVVQLVDAELAHFACLEARTCHGRKRDALLFDIGGHVGVCQNFKDVSGLIMVEIPFPVGKHRVPSGIVADGVLFPADVSFGKNDGTGPCAAYIAKVGNHVGKAVFDGREAFIFGKSIFRCRLGLVGKNQLIQSI